MNASSLRGPLLMAAIHYHEKSYEAAAMKMNGKDDVEQWLLERELKGR